MVTSSFRPSSSLQFPMSCGNNYNNILSSRLWTTYQAHLLNPFSWVIALESLILKTAFPSSTGAFVQFVDHKGWEFHKEIEQKCMNIFNSPPTG